MIRIMGAVERSFTVPGELAAVARYYRQYDRILGLLPHIHKIKAYTAEDFRMVYDTVELGIYRVQIYCDLRAKFDEKAHILTVAPLAGMPPVKEKVSVTSLIAQGYYNSASAFQAEGRQATRVDYRIELRAELPKPFGLGLVPDAVIERIAREITYWRIDEIADGFIQRSLADFRLTHPPKN
jgi:hypothetical protein